MIRGLAERLAEPGTPFAIVGGAGALAQVKDRPPQLPAVYLYLAAEATQVNQRITGPVFQRSAVEVGAVIVTENLSGQDNFEAAEDIENLKIFVRSKLIGFTPEGADDPLEHVSGELQQAAAGVIWFEDVYATARYLEEET